MYWSHLDVVDADAAVGEEAVLGALAADSCSSLLWEEVRHGRVPVAEVLNGREFFNVFFRFKRKVQ